jgi:hypothetical protein
VLTGNRTLKSFPTMAVATEAIALPSSLRRLMYMRSSSFGFTE